MSRSKKILFAAGGLLALVILVAGAWALVVPAKTTFAQQPTPTAQPGVATPAQGVWQSYRDFFLNALVERLGVTLEKFKSDYLGALTDTLDKAVKDGNLTQKQADQLKSKFSNRLDQGDLPGFFPPFGRRGFGHFGFGRGGFFGMKGGFELSSVAKALNMPVADLISELQAGKTIADVAKEKNVDLAQVKASVLSDLKARLDQAVQNGNLTQARADEIYNLASANFDSFANLTWPMGKFWRMP